MEKNFVSEVKKKKEFSQLPNSIIERALIKTNSDVKEARSLLRKYFGVFLTNRILRGNSADILKFHLSSKKRDYKKFYYEIFKNESLNVAPEINFNDGVKAGIGCDFFESVIDIGAGINGFSLNILCDLVDVRNYHGIEASGQIVDKMNEFFAKEMKGFNAHYIWLDLFSLGEVIKIIEGVKGPRVIFMFQIVDALEIFEKDYSKKLISKILDNLQYEDKIILTLPIESLGGTKKFAVNRKWLLDFLMSNSKIEKDFIMSGERILVIRKKF